MFFDFLSENGHAKPTGGFQGSERMAYFCCSLNDVCFPTAKPISWMSGAAVGVAVATSMLADGETEIDAVDVVEVAATGEAVEAVATEVSSLVMRLAHLQET